MSNKTMKQRIAVVAASALTAGFLSVVSIPAAYAATPTITINDADKGTIGVAVAKNVATLNAKTITITSIGKVGLTLAAGTGGEGILTVSGGTIAPALGTVFETGVTGPNAAGTSFVFGDTTPDVVVTPDVGATVMVIKSFDTTALYTAGTSYDKLTVTVVASSTIGVVSSSKSFASLEASTTADGSASTYTDETDSATRTNGDYGIIDWSINDGNGQNMPSTTVVTASATNGALVSFTSGAAANSTSATTTGTDGAIYIAQPTANAPVSTVVTISVNGAVWTTKSLTITGDITKISVINYTDGRYATSGTSSGALLVYGYDSAGNQVSRALSAEGSFYNSTVSSITTPVTTSTTDYAGAAYTCVGLGSSKIQYSITNTALVKIKSPETTVRCSGDPDSWTAALDKAVYTPGSVATLTITAKDSKGNLTNGVATLGTTGTYGVTIASGILTAVTAPTTVDTFTSAPGVKTYKFTVGLTTGDYQLVVDLPKWTTAGSGSATSATVGFKVASATTEVSNADVLKSIVALIASINKQIQALQKLILKR